MASGLCEATLAAVSPEESCPLNSCVESELYAQHSATQQNLPILQSPLAFTKLPTDAVPAASAQPRPKNLTTFDRTLKDKLGDALVSRLAIP